MSLRTKKHEKFSRPLEAALYNIVAAHQHFSDNEEAKAQKCVKRARTLMRQLDKRGYCDEWYALDAVANILQYVEDSWGIWGNREDSAGPDWKRWNESWKKEGPTAATVEPEIGVARG